MTAAQLEAIWNLPYEPYRPGDEVLAVVPLDGNKGPHRATVLGVLASGRVRISTNLRSRRFVVITEPTNLRRTA